MYPAAIPCWGRVSSCREALLVEGGGQFLRQVLPQEWSPMQEQEEWSPVQEQERSLLLYPGGRAAPAEDTSRRPGAVYRNGAGSESEDYRGFWGEKILGGSFSREQFLHGGFFVRFRGDFCSREQVLFSIFLCAFGEIARRMCERDAGLAEGEKISRSGCSWVQREQFWVVGKSESAVFLQDGLKMYAQSDHVGA